MGLTWSSVLLVPDHLFNVKVLLVRVVVFVAVIADHDSELLLGHAPAQRRVSTYDDRAGKQEVKFCLLNAVRSGQHPSLVDDRRAAPVSVVAEKPPLHRSRPWVGSILRLETANDAWRSLVLVALTTG